jgi:membrane fusion protein, multidrug efflux system
MNIRPLVLAFFAATTAVGFLQANGASDAKSKPVIVRVAPVVYSDAPVPIHAAGVLARRTEAELSFKINGVVESIVVRAGDRVTKDQVLARLQLDEIDAQVTQARAAREKARRDAERVAKLQANAVATLEDLQDTRTALETAEAQVRIAEFNRRYAVIVAPADGRVLRRRAEPDELVAAGRPILDFAADGDGWIVRVGVTEGDAARLRIGDRANLTHGEGAITQISEAADSVTRTVPLEIVLRSAPPTARSGTITAVTLIAQPVTPRPVVPIVALIEGQSQSASLYLVDEGSATARRVPVEIEALVSAEAYVRTELPRTSRVVVQGSEYLRDGAPIEVRE